ncbi:HNH endonuclease [Gordonia sp. OPL2]|nr:HNH endonuclease [Gordonia sp. OPL2]
MASTGEWPLRWWLVTLGCVGTAVLVAAGVVVSDGPTRDPVSSARAQRAQSTLAGVAVVGERSSRTDYQREAFGTAWTDAVDVADGANGCDTRNDVLGRDLGDTRRGPVSTCPRAVVAGEFRSPYTGEFIVFRRDRRAGAVQIDHIVPLAYAWDMGAYAWPPTTRRELANDPANLVAVDAASNLAKSDREPAVWMPPNAGFHCQYAVQFVEVVGAYRLRLDAPSKQVLAGVLARC